jgi:hypothetical protein
MVTMRDAIASTQPKEEQRPQEQTEYQLWLQHPQTQKFIGHLKIARQDLLVQAENAFIKANLEAQQIYLAQSLTIREMIKNNLTA